MLTRIRNANAVHHKTVYIPYSNIKFAIANMLQKHGYIESMSKKGRKITKVIEIDLAYMDDDKAKIKGLERVSKPSRRVYFGVKDIKPVLNGFGAIILSTPKGIMTGEDAKKGLVGGEVLFKIW